MYKIYHNPRCSKSRQTLNLLRESGIEPEIILYLQEPPSAVEIRDILKALDLQNVRDLLRKGEPIYKELGLKDENNEDVLISAMAKHPKLIERPIVIKNSRAILGRPPENVLKLL